MANKSTNSKTRAARVSIIDKKPQIHTATNPNVGDAAKSEKRKRQSDADSEAVGERSTKKNQSASAKLEMFPDNLLQAIQDAIIKLEACQGIGEACTGCRETCVDCPSRHDTKTCRACIVVKHVNHPFHSLQKWCSGHFEKHSLYELGFSLNLGHSGTPCPLNKNPPVDSVIVHVNGIHRSRILYCLCDRWQQRANWKVLQLVEHQLFPATSNAPQTAFTFSVLKDFHRHSLCSKSSAYDYCKALRSHTNAAFPQLVPDRYREFMLVMRFWRVLALLRHAGVEHKIELILDHRRSGSIAVWCPACPEIGFNLDPEVLSHIYSLILSLDGNFRLQLKKKNGDPDDRPLCRGNGYFVEDTAYRDYLRKSGKAEEVSLCSKLKAVRNQDRAKFKDTEVSGVLAAQCRHLMYLPQGLGLEGLRHQWILVTYDVWCQYHINFEKRFATFPGWEKKFVPEAPKVFRGAVPKMHIHGHNSKCQLEHSLVYQKYSGMTYGEGIESAWSEQNHGHRHDTLDDFNGFWNWTKLIQLSLALLKSYRKYKEQLASHKEDLAKLASLASPELFSEWKRIYDTSRNCEVFATKDTAPTQQDKYEILVGKENSEYGEAGFLCRGLEMEEKLLRVHNKPEKSRADRNTTTDLFVQLFHWRSQQVALYPQLDPLLPIIDEDNVFDTKLHLPSAFSGDDRLRLHLTGAADAEKELRLGLAHDLLRQLKLEIHYWNSVAHPIIQKSQKKKKKLVEAELLKNSRLDNIKGKQLGIMNRYNQNRTALISLGCNVKEAGLEKLTSDQLWGKNPFQPRKQGDSDRRDPWFWAIGKPGGISSDSWNAEDQRVRWSREKALVERLTEELDILKEEFRRTEVSFTRMAEVWRELARRNSAKPGYLEYANRHSTMYSMLAEDCREKREAINSALIHINTHDLEDHRQLTKVSFQ
ncbi:hypothetical protein NP233_g10438 [Leucocoprinus birnbaumii]|uniref:CxC2-like cysteine cluster KDZ transposase-associated domain-containing protein n=1 Tax=Leucocoprinus birnbaumii TaxID=56174 RepID=A0AAD5YLB1_9AGAR|nr:hypothetical protein NP233_g10438 [Leucocoprinus birnbaumii]